MKKKRKAPFLRVHGAFNQENEIRDENAISNIVWGPDEQFTLFEAK